MFLYIQVFCYHLRLDIYQMSLNFYQITWMKNFTKEITQHGIDVVIFDLERLKVAIKILFAENN